MLRRTPVGQGTSEQPVEVLALGAGQGRKRRFQHLAYHLMSLAKGRLATWSEPVTDRTPWSSHALDHSPLEKAVGQRAEGLVGLECHLSKRVRRRIGARADGAKRVPLGQRRADFSKPAVHPTVVAILELFDGSAQFLERDRHAAHDIASI
jgi:hypothetical protein